MTQTTKPTKQGETQPKAPQLGGQTKYRTPNSFRRQLSRRNPALMSRKRTGNVTQHRG